MTAIDDGSRARRVELFRKLNERRRTGEDGARMARVPRDGRPLPLSAAQQRFWLLQQLAPASGVYNVPLRVRLRGPLDVDALEGALSDLVARHEILRTRYVVEDGIPTQHIGAPSAVRVIEDDDLARPFDLTSASLRVALQRVAEDEHVLTVVIHHIATDGWSMQILVQELATLYDARVHGRPSPLPPLALQYADYASWQQQWLNGEDAARQLASWRERLARLPEPLEIPADRPRPAAATYRGSSVEARIDRALADTLLDLARGEGATIFMMLLAAWRVLLHRLTGATDIVIGSPVAGRTRAETERLIGPFLNTLALRLDVSGEWNFRELLRRERDASLAAFAHQEVPFEPAPLLRTLFVLQNAPRSSFAMDALDIKLLPVPMTTAMTDLTLTATEDTDGFALTLGYARDVFDESTAARYLCAYRMLLADIAVRPDATIGALRITDATARVGSAARVRAPVPIVRRFEAVAERFASRPAVTFGATTLTYAELNARANALARDLIARGIGPEVRVGLSMERGIDMVVAILAVLKAGGAYVPIDPRYPEERRRFIESDAKVALVLTDARPASTDGSNPRLDVDLDHAAYVIYTSGSTGTPKGCVVTHANVASLMEATDERFLFDEHDVWTLFHSFAFDFSVWELWGALLYGARLVVVPHDVTRAPGLIAGLLVREGVTVLNQTPSAFRSLIEQMPDGHALRYVIFGGEALDPRMLQPWIARFGEDAPQLVNMYGITETTVHVTFRRITATDCGGVIGDPLASHEVYLVDGQLQALLQGIAGEILVGGQSVARGYLDRPDLTALRFIPDPFSGRSGARLYRSGDQARVRGDGELEFLGRIDTQVKVRGFRIEAGEVEAAIVALPDVSEAVVIPRGESLVAFLVSPRPIDADGMRTALARTLPEYMIPAAFVRVDHIPLTAHGKLDRAALPADVKVSVGEPPRGATESALAAIWCDLLGISGIARDVNFFSAGGHSLLAVRMIERIRTHVGVTLPVAAVFETPTIAQLARRIDGDERSERSLVVRVREGSAPPLVLIHGGGGSVAAYGELARQLKPERAILGVQARGFEDDAEPQASVEEMAATYLAALPAPHLLAGWSLGGTIAFEMARQSGAQRVVLIDAPHPGLVQNLPDDFAIPPEIRADRVARWRALLTAQLRALARYEPTPFDGEVVLVKATRASSGLQWTRFAPRLRVIEVPGDHHSMLRTPHVEALARALERAL